MIKSEVKVGEIETFPELVKLCKFTDLDGNSIQLYPSVQKPPRGAEGYEAVRFMVGSWRGADSGVAFEEHWMDAGGGTVRAMPTMVLPCKPAFFEFQRIEKTKGGLVHQASSGGKTPVPFNLVESEGNRASFENLEHDCSQCIRYWLDDVRQLRARVEDKDGKKGDDFVFKRGGLRSRE